MLTNDVLSLIFKEINDLVTRYNFGIANKKLKNVFDINVMNSLYLMRDKEYRYFTDKECLAVVRHNGYALQFVKNQTPELCLAAIQQNWYALQFVKNQTPEICLAAVQQNGFALGYIKNQTPEICLAAIKQNGDALKYIK